LKRGDEMSLMHRNWWITCAAMVAAGTIAGRDGAVKAQQDQRPPSSVVGIQPAGPAPSAPLGPSNWLSGLNYPTTICRYAFVQVDDDVYVIGGVSGGTRVTAVQKYSPTANTWTARASLPLASEAPSAAYLAGKIYVIDGDTGTLIRIYDIATNSWSNGAARPTATSGYGTASGAYDGKVYVVGDGVGTTTLVSVYDVASNTWSAGPAAPVATQLPGYTQVGKYLYVVGGFQSGTITNSTVTMRLDMAAGSWTVGPSFTPQRADFGLALWGSKLYAIGGDTTGTSYFDSSALVDELDLSAWPGGAWAASPIHLPTARQASGGGFSTAGRMGGEIWSTGGIVGGTFTFLDEHRYRGAGTPPVTFTAAPLGTGSPGYPGTSGSQTGRMTRNEPASSCAAPAAYPGVFDLAPHAYDAYRITNVTGAPECVTVTVSTACTFIHASAYLDTFNPADVGANWIADIGNSPSPVKSFSFLLPAAQSAVLVVSEVNGACPSYTVGLNGSTWRTVYDISHDFMTDRTIFRPGTNVWYTASSDGGALATPWGTTGDIDVMGDYDGDGKADIAVFRPSTGTWYIVQSSNSAVRVVVWGAAADIPIAGDVDGDGKDDVVVYRPSLGTWYFNKSGGGTSVLGWGTSSDIPALTDYDGDGRADAAVYRPSSGTWFISFASGGSAFVGWGASGDIPVAGNWDGDAKSDVAIFRPSTGQWFVKASGGSTIVTVWGTSGDVPVSSDMDGDGKTDFTIFRSGTWFSLLSRGGSAGVVWGIAGDKPVGRVPGT
jgi:hypothetical protein